MAARKSSAAVSDETGGGGVGTAKKKSKAETAKGSSGEKTSGERPKGDKAKEGKAKGKDAARTKAATGKSSSAKKGGSDASGGKGSKGGKWRARAEVLSVREDESPWTAAELKAVRKELTEEVERLEDELNIAAAEILELVRNPGDSAGDDQADAGAQSAEREQEFTLAQNSNEVMAQSLRALHRIENGTYGLCESCEKPVGKLRLQAFPRATLCMSCKQQQERH